MSESMSYQRACRETQAAGRELKDWRRDPARGNIVDTVNGFAIVEQPDESYTIQRGLRVRGIGERWTRAQAESAAANGGTIPIQQTGETRMELEHMTMTDGYVGSMGKTWKTPTQDDLEKAILCAMEIEGKSRQEIIAILESGRSVRWCQSPNFYYDHSYGVIGRKRSAPPVMMVQCDCGHSVPQGQQMSASLGTSCPDCYDRMSG